MRALKSGRADCASRLGTTINAYEGELDWGGACGGSQTGHWLLI